MSNIPTWSTACPDWEERIVLGRSLVPFEPLFPAEAEAALEIFRDLVIVDAAGRPTIGEACRPWVFDLPRALFGAYDRESGRRLIRFFLQMVAKKNAKSTMAAGIMLTALLRNWRDSGEFYVLAPTREAADNCFAPARDMVRADNNLHTLLHIQENFRTITHRNTRAFLKVVAADSEATAGKKTIGLLVDELWQFGKRANADGMLREAMGGLAARPEGFVILLSTQSDESPAGVFAARLNEFRAIRDGKIIDPRSLAILYEFPRSMIDSGEYRNPENWRIPNPNLGVSVDLEYLVDEQAKADRAGLSSLINWQAKHLNIEVGLALRSDHWAGARHWEKQARPAFTLQELIGLSEVVTVGGDGGGLDDMLGLATVGRDKTDPKTWRAWVHCWIHESVLELRKSEAPRFLDLQSAGDLTIVKTMREAFEEFADMVEEINRAGKLAQVGLDPAGVSEIADELARRGIDEENGQVVGVSQGYKMNGVIKSTEGRLSDGLLIHGGQPLMAWSVGNARIEQRGNAILVTKQASGTAKIDGLMALFNAVSRMLDQPEAAGSIYNNAAARPTGFLVI